MTAPLVFYFGYVLPRIGRNGLLLWNLACLGQLLNIIFYGVFSSPIPFQLFGLEQPNIALARFSFVWLASVVVSIVLVALLAMIRQLIVQSPKVV